MSPRGLAPFKCSPVTCGWRSLDWTAQVENRPLVLQMERPRPRGASGPLFHSFKPLNFSLLPPHHIPPGKIRHEYFECIYFMNCKLFPLCWVNCRQLNERGEILSGSERRLGASGLHPLPSSSPKSSQLVKHRCCTSEGTNWVGGEGVSVDPI